MFTKRMITRLVFTSFMLTSLFFTSLGITPAYAAGIMVNTNVDELTTNGKCSLREAIINANNNAATHSDCATGFGIDTITFAGNYTITLAGAELPVVTSEIVINGKGAANTIIQANASPNTATYRVFQVSNTGNLTLNGLTVRHGRCNGGCASVGNNRGGGIENAGVLTVTNSTFSGNSASSGGGIFNEGTLTVTNSIFSTNSAGEGGGIYQYVGSLTVTNSTFSGNSAGFSGGGIYTYDGSLSVTNSTFTENSAGSGGGIYNEHDPLTVSNSTLSRNTATNGGGIYNFGGLTMTNSTLSGNSASSWGGGIANEGNLTVTNSTLSGNSAQGVGGGILNYNGNLIVRNSTLSGNGAAELGGGIANDGTLNYANTIIANSTSGGDCVNVNIISINTNNLVEDGSCSAALSGDPKLGALANNGGPTQTMALLAGSPAIDAGDNAICAAYPVNNLDQRGVTRPQRSHCDVGAYEAPEISRIGSAAAQDGWILESSETSNTGGSKNNTSSTIYLGDNAADKQDRAILSFNTAGLPDNATIAKIILGVKKAGIVGRGNPVKMFNGFMVDIKKGNFGTTALALRDFNAKASKSLGPFKPTHSNGWYVINLTNGKSLVNKTGNTQIRLRFKLDDNNNNVANILKLYSGNAGGGNRPYLYIEYYVP